MIMRPESKMAKKDLLIIIFSALIPTIVYLFFEQQWRAFHKDSATNFAIKFTVQALLSFCLAGLGVIIVMVLRRESFSSYGLITKNAISAVGLSIVAFVPHLIFLVITKGFHGYAPMSGAIIYDSTISRPVFQRVICFIFIFLIWGFCEGFTYIYVNQKVMYLLN